MSKTITVVGGGPGGYVAAIRAAQLGAKVNLIEEDKVGGTCLNVGCIPTKAMLHAAETYHAVASGTAIGLKVDNPRLDWAAVGQYRNKIVTRLVKGVEGLLAANGVTVHRGHAVLKKGKVVSVGGKDIAADAVILALGSDPARIPFPGADLPGVIDSTKALSLDKVPGSMAILGGGVIGVEFAAMYTAFGTKVTVIEMMPEILPGPGIDVEIAKLLRGELAKSGVEILTSAKLTEVKQSAGKLVATYEAAGAKKDVTADVVLVAVGRRPRTANAGLEDAGVAMDRARIKVDESFMTNVPGVYAIGDCASAVMLAHVASAQGVAAVEHALGHHPDYHGNIIPGCIYTHPEVACVGMTEEQVKEKGIAYKVGRFQLAGNGKSLIESEGVGVVKVLAGAKYGEILGVHIFGPRATDLITEAALALRLEATVDELISTIHAHPTVGEAMAEAALDVEGQAIHWPPARKG